MNVLETSAKPGGSGTSMMDACAMMAIAGRFLAATLLTLALVTFAIATALCAIVTVLRNCITASKPKASCPKRSPGKPEPKCQEGNDDIGRKPLSGENLPKLSEQQQNEKDSEHVEIHISPLAAQKKVIGCGRAPMLLLVVAIVMPILQTWCMLHATAARDFQPGGILEESDNCSWVGVLQRSASGTHSESSSSSSASMNQDADEGNTSGLQSHQDQHQGRL